MLKFTLTGDVPSKKNSKRILWNRKTGKPFIKSSEKHDEWHSRTLPQLFGIKRAQGQIKRIEMIFYSSSNRRADLDNRAASVLDLLTDASVIPGDDWFTVPELRLKYAGKDKTRPRVEIIILTG